MEYEFHQRFSSLCCFDRSQTQPVAGGKRCQSTWWFCCHELYGNGFLTAKKGNLENLPVLVHKLSLQWLPSTIFFFCLFSFTGGQSFSCCTISCILKKKEKGGLVVHFVWLDGPASPAPPCDVTVRFGADVFAHNRELVNVPVKARRGVQTLFFFQGFPMGFGGLWFCQLDLVL